MTNAFHNQKLFFMMLGLTIGLITAMGLILVFKFQPQALSVFSTENTVVTVGGTSVSTSDLVTVITLTVSTLTAVSITASLYTFAKRRRSGG